MWNAFQPESIRDELFLVAVFEFFFFFFTFCSGSLSCTHVVPVVYYWISNQILNASGCKGRQDILDKIEKDALPLQLSLVNIKEHYIYIMYHEAIQMSHRLQ